jgi:RNA polymerase sigma-70 factor (ECF subfamily)
MTGPADDRSLEVLLDKLAEGDSGAAERVFAFYEPYLRLMVRRQLSPELRPKFDSIDIVQSVWVDLVDEFRKPGRRFTDVNHLKAFLLRVTRNRFIDRLRRHRQALQAERPLEKVEDELLPVSPHPGPGADAEAGELWEQLLKLCPPQHHAVLLLKKQGHALEEIASRTGLHPSSVRRILYDLARRLALRRQTAVPAETPPEGERTDNP